MAEQESNSLHDAVANALQQDATKQGAMVTNFLVMVEGIDSDGDQYWAYAGAEGQRLSMSLGMVEYIRNVLHRAQGKYLDYLERNAE